MAAAEQQRPCVAGSLSAIRLFITAFTALIAAAIAAGCLSSRQEVGARPVSPSAAKPASGADFNQSVRSGALVQRLNDAQAQLRNRNESGADAILSEVIADKDFVALTYPQQHFVLGRAALIAARQKQFDRAYQLTKRSCETPQDDQGDWLFRLRLDFARRDDADRIRTLTHLAQLWPQTVKNLPERTIQSTVFVARSDPELQLALLQALFSAKYVPYTGIEPSDQWRDLALLMLQRGDTAGAIAAAQRITDPKVLIALKVDNRFAPLRAELPSLVNFDAAKAMDEQIGRWRTAVERNPDKLLPMAALMQGLLDTDQADEVLQRTDEIIARVRAEPEGSPIYRDQNEQYHWILDERAGALQQLSRSEEAVRQLEEASRLTEDGGTNVSQTINLAELYNDLGRPADALSTLKRVANVSPYGRMQIEHDTLRAALQMSDREAASRSLAYLQQHQSDAISSYQIALVECGRTQEAQQLLLARLQDPQQRQTALLAVQTYTLFKHPPAEMRQLALWRALVASPEVQAAARRVGTIEQFDIDGPENY
jgi:tetratricopeptide (TPR) repeat protein